MINYINCQTAVIGLVYVYYVNPAPVKRFNTNNVFLGRYFSVV